MLDLAVAVAKEAEAQASEVKGSTGKSVKDAKSPLPAHIKETGVSMLSFACPICTALVAPAGLGLPRYILGYASQPGLCLA